MYAARSGYLEVVKYFVENKADVNAEDNVRFILVSLFDLLLLWFFSVLHR